MSRNAAVGAALAEAPPELDLERVLVAPFRAGDPSEEFRTLRTRLEQLQATRPIQTIAGQLSATEFQRVAPQLGC